MNSELLLNFIFLFNYLTQKPKYFPALTPYWLFPASITVNRYSIPDEDAVSAIVDVSKYTINNLVDVANGEEGEKVDGTLYLTDAAIYFLSKKLGR